MLILLAISTAVAALAPQPANRGEDSTETEAVAPPTEPGWRLDASAPTGQEVVRRVRSDSEQAERIELSPGDHLELYVSSDRGEVVTIPGLGLTATTVPGTPARFDILATRAGEFEIRGEARPEPVATIAVSPGREPPGA